MIDINNITLYDEPQNTCYLLVLQLNNNLFDNREICEWLTDTTYEYGSGTYTTWYRKNIYEEESDFYIPTYKIQTEYGSCPSSGLYINDNHSYMCIFFYNLEDAEKAQDRIKTRYRQEVLDLLNIKILDSKIVKYIIDRRIENYDRHR